MDQALHESFNGQVRVRGEENLSSLAIVPHELLAVVDPLDGTAPARYLGSGFSSVALCYIKREQPGFALLAVAICSSSGIVMSWTLDGKSHVGDAERPCDDDRVHGAINPDDGSTIGVVAAKGRDRKAHRRLLADYDRIVFNTGGTPMTWALVGLEMGALVAAKWQTPWDAAYLPFVIDTGGVVITATGRADRKTVLGWFESLNLQRDAMRTVPPHVAATSPALADALFHRYVARSEAAG